MAENHSRARGRFKDLKGCTFTDLTVLFEFEVRRGQTIWACLCRCGRVTTVRSADLNNGNTKSCGCRKRKYARDQKNRRKHGLWNTPEWRTWEGIIRRCHDPLGANYNRYGALGIVVCQGWRNSVEAFVADMGLKPSRRHTIDRIDNAHGYTCGHCAECLENNWSANCRWATPKEQSRNRRSTVFLTFQGETLCLTDWASKLGVSKELLHYRLKAGWPIKDALTAPCSR